MAHIGRIYELHFRRDLALQVFDNKRAWAKRYKTGAAFIGGIIGGPLTAVQLLCNPVDEKTFEGAKWYSNYTLVGGHLVRYEIECSEAAGFPDTQCRITVREISVGILVVADALRNNNANYQTILAKKLVVPPTHPTLLSTDGPNILFQMSYVPWGP